MSLRVLTPLLPCSSPAMNVIFGNEEPSHSTTRLYKNVMVKKHHHRAALHSFQTGNISLRQYVFGQTVLCIHQFLCACRFVFIFFFSQLDVVIVTDTRQSNQNVFIIIEANSSDACVCGTSHSMRLFRSLNAVLKGKLKTFSMAHYAHFI